MRREVKIILILILIAVFCVLIPGNNGSKVKANDFINRNIFAKEYKNAPEKEHDTDREEKTLETTLDTYVDTLDFDEIQEILDENTSCSFSVKEYIKKVISGEESFSLTGLGNDILDIVKKEVAQQKNIFFQLLTLAFIAGIFSNFSSLFKNSQVGETSFYIVYLIMFSVLTVSYFSVAQLMQSTFEQLTEFMKVLLPTYFAAMTFVTGVTASLGLYELTLFTISIAELMIVKIALPVINVYFILSLANRISKEDMLSKFVETLEVMVRWGLKTLLGIVIGMHTIQSMVMPAANRLKTTAVNKTVSALPVLGDLLGSVTEAVLGAGVLVKNAVGAVGLIAVIAICVVPILKVIICNLIYRLAMTAAQPVSDKRMLECMEGAVKASELLIYTGCIGGILFFFTIVIITAFTGAGVV